jgi:DNA-binding transcriptional MerR regulator
VNFFREVKMELRTVAQIAKEVGIERERVDYLLHKAKLKPAARAGSVRLYQPEVTQIIWQLNKVPRYDLRTANIETILSQYPAIVA